MKVVLKDNMRMLDVDEADFTIHATETKELSERQLKSYSIKQYLLKGFLLLVEGKVKFGLKSAILVIDSEYPNTVFGIENGKYFKKNVVDDIITWVKEEDFPENVLEYFNEV